MTMFIWGKITCVFCDRRVPKKDAITVRERKGVGICKGCYRAWEQAGRRCGLCGSIVQGPQEVGAFGKPKRSFGHADCGGVRLVGRT